MDPNMDFEGSFTCIDVGDESESLGFKNVNHCCVGGLCVGIEEEKKLIKKRKLEPFLPMLDWVKHVAKNPCDPVVGSLPDIYWWKVYGSEHVWKQALIAKDIMSLKVDVDADPEFPQLLYCDRVSVMLEPPIERIRPVVAGWKSKDLKRRDEAEIRNGGYGFGELLVEWRETTQGKQYRRKLLAEHGKDAHFEGCGCTPILEDLEAADEVEEEIEADEETESGYTTPPVLKDVTDQERIMSSMTTLKIWSDTIPRGNEQGTSSSHREIDELVDGQPSGDEDMCADDLVEDLAESERTSLVNAAQPKVNAAKQEVNAAPEVHVRKSARKRRQASRYSTDVPKKWGGKRAGR